MNFRNEVPLFRPLLLFIAGILIAIYLPLVSIGFSVIACLIFTSLLFIQYLFSEKLFSYKTRWTTGVIVALVSFSFGYSITLLNNESGYSSHFRNISNASAYIGYIKEPVSEKEKTWKTILKITSVRENGSWVSTTGNCLVYFSKDSFASTLRYGDLILSRSTSFRSKTRSEPFTI